MRNPLPALARALGTRPWLMRCAPGVVAVDRWLHRVSRGRVSLVSLARLPWLRLVTTGRRTGQARETNLLYYPLGDDVVLVGSNWGLPREPAWTLNLRAQPAASILWRGRHIPVRARELRGTEYDRLWRALLDFWPGYAMEQAAARRSLPIFVLSRRS